MGISQKHNRWFLSTAQKHNMLKFMRIIASCLVARHQLLQQLSVRPCSIIMPEWFLSSSLTKLTSFPWRRWSSSNVGTVLVLMPSGTSSGWLKAIPQTSLGLAIPGPEFIVGLCLWLGVPLFPLSPLCTCLSSIEILRWPLFSWPHENLSPWCLGWHPSSCFFTRPSRRS